MQNVPSIFEEPDPVCQRAQYGSFENGTISLYNSGSYASGEFSEICGWAEQADPENNPGELYIYFPATSGLVGRYAHPYKYIIEQIVSVPINER